MMAMHCVAEAVSGVHKGADARINAVTTDSRCVKNGDLFVALRGERFNGHDFAENAVRGGAVGMIVDTPIKLPVPQVVVGDTERALGELAGYWRRRFDIPVVAVTGSNGKTTVKELIGSILNEHDKTIVSKGNLNNAIGLPLSLLEIRNEHRYAVMEIGMNQVGEIRYLTTLAKPTVAVITNAAQAHLEFIKSVRQVAVEKGSIVEGLDSGGVAVLNRDDAHFDYWRSQTEFCKTVTFGLASESDVSAAYCLGETSSELQVSTPHGSFEVTIPLAGLHNVKNALAAVAVAICLDVPLMSVRRALEQVSPVEGRLQFRRHLKGGVLLDDSYNANPSSMAAGIEVLSNFRGDRRLIVGDMFELGEKAAAFHEQVGERARKAGIGRLYALGDLSVKAAQRFGRGARHYRKWHELADDLIGEMDASTTILVKGSRGMRMDRIADRLCVSTDPGESEPMRC